MKLSIVIPVYNVERYVRQCVESVYMQGLDDLHFGGSARQRLITYMYTRMPRLFVYVCYAANLLRKRLR